MNLHQCGGGWGGGWGAARWGGTGLARRFSLFLKTLYMLAAASLVVGRDL